MKHPIKPYIAGSGDVRVELPYASESSVTSLTRALSIVAEFCGVAVHELVLRRAWAGYAGEKMGSVQVREFYANGAYAGRLWFREVSR